MAIEQVETTIDTFNSDDFLADDVPNAVERHLQAYKASLSVPQEGFKYIGGVHVKPWAKLVPVEPEKSIN